MFCFLAFAESIEDNIPTFRLVQDNNAVYSADIIKEWFAQHPKVEVLGWPAKSLDLNLIENIWVATANLWDFGHKGTRAQLVAYAKTVWKSLRSFKLMCINWKLFTINNYIDIGPIIKRVFSEILSKTILFRVTNYFTLE